MPLATVLAQPACDSRTVSGLGQVAGEVAVACAVDPWYGAFFAGATFEVIGDEPVGAVYRSLANGLQGMAVWVGDNAKGTELVLYEASNDGRTIGPEVARGQAVGADEYGLVDYTFDPIVDSAGKTYVFRVTCLACDEEKPPTLFERAGTGGARQLHQGRQDLHRPRPPPLRRSTTACHRPTPPGPSPRPPVWAPATGGSRPTAPRLRCSSSARPGSPGLKATATAVRVPAYEADGAFVGVPLTVGKHVVTLQYERPASARLRR